LANNVNIDVQLQDYSAREDNKNRTFSIHRADTVAQDRTKGFSPKYSGNL